MSDAHLIGIAIVAALFVLALVVAKARKKKPSAPQVAPAPLTPEEIETRRKMGEDWEQWKRDNGASGP